MSLYYKKKLISGVRDVPSMTLAQYNLLTNKPKLWIRTDAPEGDRGINADDIQYDSDTSVKEKIDENNTWVNLGTLTSGGTGIDISDYQELNIQPLVNGEYKYNPFHFIKNNINGAYLNIYEATHSWVGNFSVNSSGVLAFTTTLITGWSSMSLLVYGKK